MLICEFFLWTSLNLVGSPWSELEFRIPLRYLLVRFQNALLQGIYADLLRKHFGLDIWFSLFVFRSLKTFFILAVELIFSILFTFRTLKAFCFCLVYLGFCCLWNCLAFFSWPSSSNPHFFIFLMFLPWPRQAFSSGIFPQWTPGTRRTKWNKSRCFGLLGKARNRSRPPQPHWEEPYPILPPISFPAKLQGAEARLHFSHSNLYRLRTRPCGLQKDWRILTFLPRQSRAVGKWTPPLAHMYVYGYLYVII